MTSVIGEVAALTIGHVESVAPDGISVALELDAPQSTALNAGQPIRFPRINGFVLIPNESGAVVGLIAWLGIEHAPYPKRPGLRDFGVVDLPFPMRKMKLIPVGTLSSGPQENGNSSYRLERGVVGFPSVGDPVRVPTAAQLRSIVQAEGHGSRVTIGRAPLALDAPISVDPNRLFGRHLAILGNTGSGKSCSVAGLIRWSLEAASEARGEKDGEVKPTNARFIVLDPNGEYREAFEGAGTGFRLFQAPPIEKPAQELRVPAWIWNSHEWSAFARAAPGVQKPLLLDALRALRAGASIDDQETARLAQQTHGYHTVLQEILAGSPQSHSAFPQSKDVGNALETIADLCDAFSGTVDDVDDQLAEVERLAREAVDNRRWTGQGGKSGFDGFSEAEIRAVYDALGELKSALPDVSPLATVSEDTPLQFGVESLPPHLQVRAAASGIGTSAQFIATLTMRIRSMLADNRLRPIVDPTEEITLDQWLADYIGADQGSNGEVVVIDLSLVSSEILQLVVAVIARVIFEAQHRYHRLKGEELPTALILEEAHSFVHRYAGEDDAYATPGQMCRETFERIAREGRKFGLGLVLSSQRPSELSPTVLAQCNTFLLHRLVNDHDQNLVGRLVPDNLAGLLRELPSLPTQQAILLGWATPVPVLVQIRDLEVDHRPRSPDPEFWKVWTGEEERTINWSELVKDWTATAESAE